ncbi:MAG: PLP-dependent aminotransferase family protein [Paracoccus sp. (in: a-proteobacteria)]|nr:PLP-dependent aminotransferase family protein [Paracoccus sp. (in: a-proteobacteria)]
MSQRHFAANEIPDAKIASESIYLQGDPSQTLQARLSAGVVRAILESRAAPGTRLPSTRALATQLGISRMTVTLVYQELDAQGYIEALPRSGFAVASSVPHRRVTRNQADTPGAVDWAGWMASTPVRKRVIRKPANWREFRFPFIYGQADARLFNHSAWRDCARRALGTRDFGQLAADQYSQDDPMLVDYICSNTLPRRGIHVDPSQVLVTLGAQNALYIAVELLAGPDRLAVTEEPGYPDFAEVLRRSRSPMAFVAVDEGGLDPARLPHGTRLVMVTPSHNIPTGATMPMARRRDLLARAEAEDFLIIEDDYEFEMSYLEPPAPALKSLDHAGRVIYVGSFSKSLFPGLRIGYMVGAPGFIARARSLRSMILRHAPSHLQRITAYFLALGHYDAHIVRLRESLGRRRAALESALADTGLRIAGAARQGGSSLWIEGPPGSDSSALAAVLIEDSVLIEPGEVFFERPPAPCPFFRLGYSSIASDDIAQGVARIWARSQTLPQT